MTVALFGDDSILSHFKQQTLHLQKKEAITKASKLATSWINPISMRYTYQKGNQFPNQLLESFIITIDQPIFKSKGIWEAIKYAKATKGLSLVQIKEQKNQLLFSLYKALFEYQKTELSIQKERYALKNAQIDVKVKEDSYFKGELDSSFLDSAIVKKNQIALQLLRLQENLVQLEQTIKDISGKSPQEIPLPHLSIVGKKEFLQRNIPIAKTLLAIKTKRALKNMAISRHLPSLSLFASYNYQKMEGSQFFPQFSYMNHYYTYGIRASMPLFDLPTFKDIEYKKLELLKAKLKRQEERFLQSNLYAKELRTLRLIDKKIALSKEDRALYKRLVKSTKEGVKAGDKTIYDLETMRNSLAQKRLDIKIFTLQKQLELLKLYKEMEDAF